MPAETALQKVNANTLFFKINPNIEMNSIQTSFQLKNNSVASLKIYSVYGTLVSEVFSNKSLASGEHTFNQNASKMTKGLYLAVLTIDNQVTTNKFKY